MISEVKVLGVKNRKNEDAYENLSSATLTSPKT